MKTTRSATSRAKAIPWVTTIIAVSYTHLAYLDLQSRARREKRGTQELLTMYVIERWWERLSRSRYAGDFVLKGGMLLAAFGHRRTTADADALAFNLASEASAVMERVVAVASIPGDDGVDFLTDTVTASVIRDLSLIHI